MTWMKVLEVFFLREERSMSRRIWLSTPLNRKQDAETVDRT